MASTSRIIFPANVQYKGTAAFLTREEYATVAEMKAAPELGLNEGCVAVVLENKKRYEFKRDNSVDGVTGKWREVSFLTEEAKESILANVKPVSVESAGLVHKIKFGDDVVGTINIPKDVFATAFEYVSAEKKIKLTTSNSDGSNPTVTEISVADLVDTYTAGTGLSVQGNEFSLTSDYTALPAKVTTLEGKVQALEQASAANNNYELGFVQVDSKFPVAEDANKLYVELPKANSTKDGLMTKEQAAKLEGIELNVIAISEADYATLERENRVDATKIYMIRN